MNYPIKSISRFGEIKAPLSQPTLYIFDGKRGQNLTLGVCEGTAKAKLFTPSGQGLIALDSGEWKGILPESGIYRVLVYPQQESTNSAIKVDLSQHLTANSNGFQVQDWRLLEYTYKGSRLIEVAENGGKISLDISLIGEQIQPLTVDCQRGQTLTVKANAVTLGIKSPAGQLLSLKEEFVAASIPENGIYQVLVIGEDYPITTPITVNLQ